MSCKVLIIGGGIIGLATAKALSTLFPRLHITLIEAEWQVALHQTGHNSGVIHSGLYYKPGSLKAKNCVLGREEMIRFCESHTIPYERCGKIVVATHADEIPALDELERRGRANELQQLKRLSCQEEIQEYEPCARGVAALWVGETGIVDYTQVAQAFVTVNRHNGVKVETNRKFTGCSVREKTLVLHTTEGEIESDYLINCAGLQSDHVARLCGVDPQLEIIPFRGEYYELIAERRHLVRNLIYPVPDPRFPFLGVHFTRMIGGGVEAGPNAVLALKREGYGKWSFSVKDSWDIACYQGFWKMAARYWKTGFGELCRSMSKTAFVRALSHLLPNIRESDLKPARAGVRAQAVDRFGSLVDDFRIMQAERMIHVLNAPSPAATASIAIGETIAQMAQKQFALEA